MMRRLALLLFLLYPTGVRAEEPAAVKVGAIYAMTGDWASWGKNCQQGTELALETLRRDQTAPKLALILEDSPNAKPMSALSAFRKLADIDHVKYILGPMSPEEYAAVAPVADQSGIPLLPFVSSRIEIPAAAFMWMDPETEAQRIADYVAKRHKSVAILSSNQEWESQVGKTFKQRLFEKGVSAQSYIPKRHLREELGQALRDIFSCVTKDEARQKLRATIESYHKSAPEWCRFLEENIEECFAIYALPRDFHRKLRTVNGLELVNREIKRRTRVATIFPNSASCLRLVSALLIEIHEEWLQLKMPYVHMGQRQKSTMANDDTFAIYRKNVA